MGSRARYAEHHKAVRLGSERQRAVVSGHHKIGA